MKWLTGKLGERAGEVVFWAGVLLLAAAILTLAYCTGRNSGGKDAVIDQQAAEIDTLDKIGNANQGAADQRVSDSVRQMRETQELQDALNSETDPDKQRALRGCVIMRQQNRNTSGIAACSGSAGKP